jgi:RNA polymerase sigma-70 factor (ECF subfamily)
MRDDSSTPARTPVDRDEHRARAEAPPGGVTALLQDVTAGKQDAFDRLLPLVYDELRRVAARYLRRERPNHTLQPTALVHESYLRLVDQRAVHWQNRAHFFAIAAQAMRRILIDEARCHRRSKRGGGERHLSLGEVEPASQARSVDLLALDQALGRLAVRDARQARVVELRYFGGLTIEEAAEVIGISEATVRREWTMAKAWLRRELSDANAAHD